MHQRASTHSFKGELFLTSRCASLIIFGDLGFRSLEENGVRIHEERRLMSEIDNLEGMEKPSEFSDQRFRLFPMD